MNAVPAALTGSPSAERKAATSAAPLMDWRPQPVVAVGHYATKECRGFGKLISQIPSLLSRITVSKVHSTTASAASILEGLCWDLPSTHARTAVRPVPSP